MTEERIITAATIITGEKNDGKELKTLYNKSKATGMEIENIIGDAALCMVWNYYSNDIGP